MEPAVGLLGLAGLYKEAASVVHSVRNYPSKFLRLTSRYNATNVLFERWGKQVGIADGNDLEKNTHTELKDPKTKSAVAGWLTSIRDVFADANPPLAQYNRSIASKTANPANSANSGRTTLRSRLKWALTDSRKLGDLTKDFDDLVQKLYHLVPPESFKPTEFQKLQAMLIQPQRTQDLHRSQEGRCVTADPRGSCGIRDTVVGC